MKAVPGSGDDDDEDDIIEFNPEFTYPIFGEQEQIFGYKDLMINVREEANLCTFFCVADCDAVTGPYSEL